MGGYYLANRFVKIPYKNDAIKFRKKEIITQALLNNLTNTKQILPSKEALIDFKTDAPNKLDNPKSDIVKSNQSNEVDVHEKYAAMG